ncbi:hypothetical protein [Phocaeicola sp.]
MEDNFFNWLKHQKFTIILALFCAFIPLLFSNIGWSSESMESHSDVKFLLDHSFEIGNIFFIFITLVMLIRTGLLIDKDDGKSEKLYEYVKNIFGSNSKLARNGEKILFKRMQIGIGQFYYSWLCIWVIWLLMYICKFVYGVESEFFCNNAITFRYIIFFENILNIIGSFVFFFIYMVITISTVDIGSLSGDNKSTMHIAVIALMFIGFTYLSVDYFSTFICCPSRYANVQLGVRLVVGIIASISIMAVLGRLNSSYLDIPQWLVMCLYLYASVQVLYPFIADLNGADPLEKNVLGKVVYGISFGGKICLFLVIRWITQRRRFLFFLLHKANSLAESDEMLRKFNKSYDGCNVSE